MFSHSSNLLNCFYNLPRLFFTLLIIAIDYAPITNKLNHIPCFIKKNKRTNISGGGGLGKE